MYELNRGSERLATALKQIQDDEQTIKRLASILNYTPRQLNEDIAAMYDRICKAEQEERGAII